jgi:lysozyme family protein
MPNNTSAQRFDDCLAAVLRQEGGYSDNPADPGGATNMSVTRQTLAEWRKVSPWQSLPKAEVQSLSRTEAAAIYKANYWDKCRGDQLPPGLDLALFDFAVNSGPDRAVNALQAEFNGLAIDGAIGPATLAAIAARVAHHGAGGLVNALCNRRLTFLRSLAAFATFGTGWTRRVADIRTAAIGMAGVKTPIQQVKGLFMLNILSGYKTYIVGAAMLIAALAQLLGVNIPAFDSQSAGDLLMQGLAIVFLRRGIANTVNGPTTTSTVAKG